ncbi:hypothetical protein [uncultured Dokdonia sp.]|uniref:toxin-antitoxin system YwqK family antitoxin n=1 Tax=uncultured Dokdonia sp. TaxID=575653 RepID=UPI0030EB94B5|tara:strand:+ start:13064 stop:13867 length:804 start_codon:yes stop_codon:yes gene_type:complete
MRPPYSYLTIFLVLLSTHITSAQENEIVEYFNTGEKKSVGLKNAAGFPTGEWVYYRKDGAIDTKLTFNGSDNPVGPFEMYYRNGQLQTKGSYASEGFYSMDGPYEDYYSNGQLRSKGVYKENRSVGSWMGYWENGQLKSKTTYSSEGVIISNTEYHNNGNLRLDATYTDKGDFTGNLNIYYEDGTLFTSQEFDALGNKKGVYTSFYKNGSIKEQGEYAGIDYFKKKGAWKSFYKDGTLQMMVTYDNEGNRLEIKRYDTNGNLIPEKE